MNAAIFSFVRHSENSMIASTRIATFISRKMDIRIYDYRDVEELLVGPQLDLLIIVNGAFGFCRCLAELSLLVLVSKRIVWVQNDYTIEPPKIGSNGVSPFRAAFRERHEKGLPHMDFWTTCEDFSKFTPASLYVNWNALTFDEDYDPMKISVRRINASRHDNLLYYGSFRSDGAMGKEGYRVGKKGREKYFDRYFKAPVVDTVISTPAKQFQDKYAPMTDKITFVDAFKEYFYNEIGSYGMGLYLEDRMSHERFHSPANRFYEMLSAGLPMVFQPEAEGMMARAGYKTADFLAYSAKSVAGHMERREEIGKIQRQMWIGDDPGKFRRVLEEQFDSALQTQMDQLA